MYPAGRNRGGRPSLLCFSSTRKYRLSLFSGLQKNQCTIPDNPTDESRIRLPEKNSCKEAVLFGKTYIDVVRSTTAKITLDYAVTAISVSLTGIPADAQAVAVQFAPVSSGIDFKGNPADDRQHCTLHCYKYEKWWVCNPTYIIPHSQGETSVSIRVTLPQEEEIHEYTYKAALKPGYPYRFNGDLETNLALEGDFHIEGWQPEIDVELGADKTLPEREHKPALPVRHTIRIQKRRIRNRKTLIHLLSPNCPRKT